jgi:HPr kinase/phosphorylase
MQPKVSIREILDSADKSFGLHVLAGQQALSNAVSVPSIQKLGLALAGFKDFVQPERVQVLGKPEMAYLKSLSVKKRRDVIAELCRLSIACIIITNDLKPPRRLVEACSARKIPLLRTRASSARLVSRLSRFLEEELSDHTRVHGALVDVFGLGVLLQGKSGIGKSEAALDLIGRGHRLVADDLVEIRRVAHKRLLGRAHESLGFHMEIRGLGIINVLDLFGTTSTRERMPIDLVLHLVGWAELPNPDRTGLVENTVEILNVVLPQAHIPVTPGRNLATIVEVASRNQLLKQRGTFSARAFNERVLERLRLATPEAPPRRRRGSGGAVTRLSRFAPRKKEKPRGGAGSGIGARRTRSKKSGRKRT